MPKIVPHANTDDMTIEQMVEHYNYLAAKCGENRRNSKFRNREAGIRAIRGLEVQIEALAEEVRRDVVADQDAAVAEAAQRPTVPSADPTPTDGEAPPVAPRRTPTVSDDAKITVLVDNPKRPGSRAHADFAHYRSGMRVGTYADRVGDRRRALRCITWDWDHGFITVE